MPIELKGLNYYSKVFKRINYRLSNSTFWVVITVLYIERKYCSRCGCTLYSPLIIVISLQLRGRRQIAEPRKYCLVRVIVFPCRVFSLFLFLIGWEFGLIPYILHYRRFPIALGRLQWCLMEFFFGGWDICHRMDLHFGRRCNYLEIQKADMYISLHIEMSSFPSH